MSGKVDFYFPFGYFSLSLASSNLRVIVWQKAGLALRLVVLAKQSLQTTLPLSFHWRKNFATPKITFEKKEQKIAIRSTWQGEQGKG